MNPALKGRIHPSLERVSESTENVFTDQFFEGLDVVANALDNVLARRYVDARCVSARVPLLESGTLGPKGHVQVVIPFQTESYGTQNDPVEEGEIPYCTLKMFPEETFHCVEFARDKFGKLFNLRPKAVVKILNDASFTPNTPEEVK
jgi:molybdopterin/thiamine biosynthesis adenylyltransferase